MILKTLHGSFGYTNNLTTYLNDNILKQYNTSYFNTTLKQELNCNHITIYFGNIMLGYIYIDPNKQIESITIFDWCFGIPNSQTKILNLNVRAEIKKFLNYKIVTL